MKKKSVLNKANFEVTFWSSKISLLKQKIFEIEKFTISNLLTIALMQSTHFKLAPFQNDSLLIPTSISNLQFLISNLSSFQNNPLWVCEVHFKTSKLLITKFKIHLKIPCISNSLSVSSNYPFRNLLVISKSISIWI